MYNRFSLTIAQLRAAKAGATRANEVGQEAWVARTRTVRDLLRNTFLRDDLCLKVFAAPGADQKEQLWGGTTIGDATRIQNLFAIHGLAPRVFGVGTLNEEFPVQVVEYAKGAGKPDISRAEKVAAKYHISVRDLLHSERTRKAYLARPEKWVGGKLVDFGRFFFQNRKALEARLRGHVARYHKKMKGRADTKIGYQPCPELRVEGKRDIDWRWKKMGLDRLDLAGKRVLDLGCNQGAFTRLLERQGAPRVVGVDHKFISGNRELANYLGDWRCDFVQTSLPKGRGDIAKRTGIEQFDLVMSLSVLGHMGGYANWFPRLVAPGGVVYFEGQGSDSRSTYQKVLMRDFAQVEWMGEITDHGVHPLWRLTKGA